ncbi:MAG: VCBS repeat-containing protein [Polyangiales bacterium]
MRQLASIVVAALLAGCSESAAPATIDATVADASGMDVAVDEAAATVGEEPPQVFGPWPGMLPDVLGTSEVFAGVSPDVIMTPRCVPGTTARCVCDDLREGLQGCYPEGAYRACVCPPAVIPPEQPPPPRLVRPLSGLRVTSQRPTLRWVLPEGVTRARVEVCADRPCARVIERGEVSGSSWRPTMRLPPGVVFWRVQGLSASGGVAWTSATWEFGVRHSDAPVDTAYGSLKDYNGDGYDDLVAVLGTIPAPSTHEPGRGHPFIFAGSRAGIAGERSTRLDEEFCGVSTFETQETFNLKLESADVNGDGLADLVVAGGLGDDPCGVGETVFVYRGISGGVDRAPLRIRRPIGSNWAYFAGAFCTGDVNGDGFGDVVVVGETFLYHEHRLLVYLGSARGIASEPLISVPWIWRETASGTRWFEATAGDVDGDGYTDVIARTAGNTAIFYGDPVGDLQRANILPGDSVTLLGNRIAVDVNLDDRSDVIGGSPTTLWEAVGGGLIQTYQRFGPGSRNRGELDLLRYGVVGRPGDGNGDGIIEIVSRDFCVQPSTAMCNSGVISLYERNATALGFGIPRDLRPATVATRVTFPGDLDGDGADELVIAEDAVIEVRSLVRETVQRVGTSAPAVIRLE